MKIAIGLMSVSLLWAGCKTETDKIEFGSNNGNVININGKKIYYEEYGKGTPLLLLSGGGINRSIKGLWKMHPDSFKTFQSYCTRHSRTRQV